MRLNQQRLIQRYNKLLHWIFTPLHSVKTSELNRYVEKLEKNMKARTWQALWKGKETQVLWSEPDEDVVSLIPRLKREKVHRVLDLGCGIGRHVVFMAKSGFETYGLDSSEHGISHCRKWLAAENINAMLTVHDMGTLPYEDDFFDFVVSWNVIYHTTRENMKNILSEIRRVLRQSGLLYLTLNTTRNKHYGHGIEVEPGTFDNPDKGDGQHLHHYSDEADVRNLLSDWQIEEMAEFEESLSGKKYPGSWHWMILARKPYDPT